MSSDLITVEAGQLTSQRGDAFRVRITADAYANLVEAPPMDTLKTREDWDRAIAAQEDTKRVITAPLAAAFEADRSLRELTYDVPSELRAGSVTVHARAVRFQDGAGFLIGFPG